MTGLDHAALCALANLYGFEYIGTEFEFYLFRRHKGNAIFRTLRFTTGSYNDWWTSIFKSWNSEP